MLPHLVKFLQVGAVGFAIDAFVLWLLVYQVGWSPILSRGFSFVATIIVTFILNARYTFSADIRASSKSRYVLVQVAGVVLNFSVYSGLVLTGWLGPLGALVVGSALASAHNFLMLRRFVFVPVTSKAPPAAR